MPLLSVVNPTLLDVAKRLDPDGKIAAIVELLNQTNEVLDDAVYVESNQPTSHRTTVRTGIPQPTWRKLYGGVQPTKSTTAQITDNIGNLEAYAEVDKMLADLNGNTSEFRLSEERPHLEGINQELVQTLFYGNEGTEPEAFTGLSPRYNSTTAGNGQNVISAGGSTGSLSSAWLVVWSPNTVHMLYPKGSKAGVDMTDKGQVTIEDADGSGGRMEAYRTHYKMSCGLTVRDWRYVARVANIDVSDLDGTSGTQATSAASNLVRKMIIAAERIQNLGMGKAAWYMHPRVREGLRLLILEKIAPASLTYENVAGKRVMTFDGIPVRRCDQLLLTETAVS